MPSLRDYIEDLRTNDHHARIWTVVGGMAALVALPLAVILAVYQVNNDPGSSGAIDGSSDPFSGVKVSIDSPNVDGADVPHCSTVSGTVSGLSTVSLLWFVIQQPNEQQQQGEFYVITPVPTKGDGSWIARNVTTGDEHETGRPFWFQIYLTDRKTTSLMRREDYYDSNMPTLPRGFLKLMSERQVRRGAYNQENCGFPQTN